MISGPPARWTAPSTPPPPASDWLAALTIASTANVVMSARRSVSRPAPTRRSCCSSGIGALEPETGVVSAEAERRAEREIDRRFAPLVGHVVQVALRIGLVQVDRGWRVLVVNGHNGDDGFDGARGAEQVAVHRLGGRHRHGGCDRR